jgi:hypothetical protein
MSPGETNRIIKVFLSSPSDVQEEREGLARVIRDINEVLAFLVPEKRLSLQLLSYETHVHPDLGPPQDVINSQIPDDYDIFVGVMWRRCGTPTKAAASGTIEEFKRARERREKGRLPIILFYFCDQAIPIPTQDELSQLAGVVKFRDEMASLGLTSSYPTHSVFADRVRGGLLRAIGDLLRAESQAIQPMAIPSQGLVNTAALSEMIRLAEKYESVRAAMQSGPERTRRMTEVFSEMKVHAAGVLPRLPEFLGSSIPGRRLVAISILQMFPQRDYLEWLSTRLDPNLEKPFVGYQAAIALLEAASSLPVTECSNRRQAIQTALELGKQLTGDPGRLHVLENANLELNRRCPTAQLG